MAAKEDNMALIQLMAALRRITAGIGLGKA
jgi:hypothetical protein